MPTFRTDVVATRMLRSIASAPVSGTLSREGYVRPTPAMHSTPRPFKGERYAPCARAACGVGRFSAYCVVGSLEGLVGRSAADRAAPHGARKSGKALCRAGGRTCCRKQGQKRLMGYRRRIRGGV